MLVLLHAVIVNIARINALEILSTRIQALPRQSLLAVAPIANTAKNPVIIQPATVQSDTAAIVPNAPSPAEYMFAYIISLLPETYERR